MVYHSPAGLPVPSAPSDPELRHDPDDREAPRTSAPPDLNDPRAKRAKEMKEAERNAVSHDWPVQVVFHVPLSSVDIVCLQ